MRILFLSAVAASTLLTAGAPSAQCPTLPLLNYDGGGQVTCPCFVPGEEAGVILNAPAAHYPIEILKIRIGWASQFGGAPQSLEQALHIYPGTLPNPGAPQFSLAGPVLTDGAINEFDIEFIPGNKTVTSGPFVVTLEFANTNAGMIFSPSTFHDGNGCQGGRNVVFASPGSWFDACLLGVSGDWIMEVDYRSLAGTVFTVTPNLGINIDQLSTTPVTIGQPWTATLTPGATRTAMPPGLDAWAILLNDAFVAPGIPLDVGTLAGLTPAPTSELNLTGAPFLGLAPIAAGFHGASVATFTTGVPLTTAILCLPWAAQAIVLGDVLDGTPLEADPMFSTAVGGVVGQ